MRTRFTDLVGIDKPLVGFSRSPGVVAGVTNEGGLGVLAISAYTPEALDAQLTWIEEQVGGRPYGIDLLVPEKFVDGDSDQLLAELRAQIPQEHLDFVDCLLDKYDIPRVERPKSLPGGDFGEVTATSIREEGVKALLDVVFSHQVALVANALGPAPRSLVERSHAAGAAVAALVGDPRHVSKQLDNGVDVLVAQGTEAGGHTGTIATMVLTPEVVDIASGQPVLAAGGIASGRQMAAALALGAAGAWCGSVWLSSAEDVTPDVIKQKFVKASSSDTTRSRARTGKPARQLNSPWYEAWDGPDSPGPLPLPLQPLLTAEAWAQIDDAARKGHRGATELSSFYIGQVVGSFSGLRSTREIAREMIQSCETTLRQMSGLVRN
jgi:NAD(P)H-dependent flavin oxidoreductase YrpB (nitropropane dioxygenase family)